MFDNQLIALILSTLNQQLVVAGIPGMPIVQANQPTNQGVLQEPAAYLHKVGDHRIGWPEKIYVWNENTQQEENHDRTSYQTMFQISTLATQVAGNVSQLTASDYLNLISYILQSDVTIGILSANGVGILHIGQIANPYFKDDRDRYEASPSLTFTLTHNQVINTTAPYTEIVNFNLLPIN